jgi:hypothetical protein
MALVILFDKARRGRRLKPNDMEQEAAEGTEEWEFMVAPDIAAKV